MLSSSGGSWKFFLGHPWPSMGKPPILMVGYVATGAFSERQLNKFLSKANVVLTLHFSWGHLIPDKNVLTAGAQYPRRYTDHHLCMSKFLGRTPEPRCVSVELSLFTKNWNYSSSSSSSSSSSLKPGTSSMLFLVSGPVIQYTGITCGHAHHVPSSSLAICT